MKLFHIFESSDGENTRGLQIYDDLAPLEKMACPHRQKFGEALYHLAFAHVRRNDALQRPGLSAFQLYHLPAPLFTFCGFEAAFGSGSGSAVRRTFRRLSESSASCRLSAPSAKSRPFGLGYRNDRISGIIDRRISRKPSVVVALRVLRRPRLSGDPDAERARYPSRAAFCNLFDSCLIMRSTAGSTPSGSLSAGAAVLSLGFNSLPPFASAA